MELDQQEQMGSRVSLDLMVSSVPLETQDHKDHKVAMGITEHLELQVRRVLANPFFFSFFFGGKKKPPSPRWLEDFGGLTLDLLRSSHTMHARSLFASG